MPQGRQPGRSAEEGACTAPQQPSSAWLDHQEAERHNKVHVRGASSCLPSRLAPAAAPCHCPTFLSRCQAPRIAQGARAQREQRGRCLRRRPWATRHLAGRVDGGPCQQARSHRRGNTRPWRTRPAETRRLGTALRCPPSPPRPALPTRSPVAGSVAAHRGGQGRHRRGAVAGEGSGVAVAAASAGAADALNDGKYVTVLAAAAAGGTGCASADDAAAAAAVRPRHSQHAGIPGGGLVVRCAAWTVTPAPRHRSPHAAPASHTVRATHPTPAVTPATPPAPAALLRAFDEMVGTPVMVIKALCEQQQPGQLVSFPSPSSPLSLPWLQATLPDVLTDLIQRGVAIRRQLEQLSAAQLPPPPAVMPSAPAAIDSVGPTVEGDEVRPARVPRMPLPLAHLLTMRARRLSSSCEEAPPPRLGAACPRLAARGSPPRATVCGCS